MKIGLLSTQTGWGGGENLLAQLIVGLRRAGTQAVLATPRGSAMLSWASDQDALPTVALPDRGRGPRAAWRLRRALLAHGCEAAVLNDPHGITWGGIALAGTGVARVGVRHTSFPVRSGWKHNHLIDRCVCVSEAARDECLVAGVGAEKIDLIYAGLDPLEADPRCVADERSKMLAAGDRDAHLLAIGGLLTVKGFDTLVEAVALGSEQGRRWRLWIAGEGPEREALRRLASERGVGDRVHLLGFRDDIGVLLGAADLFVSASHREGLSLVLIEAMHSGTPVVATPVGGNREALRMDGGRKSDVAWSFEPGDAAAAAAAITQAVTDSPANRERVDAAARWAARQYSLDRMARDYLTSIERVAPHRMRRAA